MGGQPPARRCFGSKGALAANQVVRNRSSQKLTERPASSARGQGQATLTLLCVSKPPIAPALAVLAASRVAAIF